MNLTEEEAATYDRQIRLWGLDAQKRLRASRICVLGIFGLGAEVCKNLVLAGIKSLCIVDHRTVGNNCIGSQFLVRDEDQGKNIAEAAAVRLQILNPNVQIDTETSNPEKLEDGFFKQFDVVCALGLGATSSYLERVNTICRAENIKFYCGEVFGFHGYFFSDLGSHFEFVKEEVKSQANVSIDEVTEAAPSADEPSAKRSKPSDGNDATTDQENNGSVEGEEDGEDSIRMVKKVAEYVPWRQAVKSDWSCAASARTIRRTSPIYYVLLVVQQFIDRHGRLPSSESCDADVEQLQTLRETVLTDLRLDQKVVPNDVLRQCVAELSPVCAVVGGVLGQEVIKAVSGRDVPFNNFFFYHGIRGSGMVEKLGYS